MFPAVFVRYLGPHISFDGRLACETSRRVQAARNTYSLFKRFFAKTASLRWRRVVFRAMVVGVALAGLVAFAPPSTETNEVDKCLLALARKALRGDATFFDGHMRTKSAKLRWEQLKLVPMDVALAVQRYLWRQQIVSEPPSAWSFLFAFFRWHTLVCMMLWTTEERPHFSRIRGCVCWCLMCRGLTTCCSSTIWTMQWLVRRNSSLMLKSRKREWSTKRIPPPSVPRDEEVLPSPVVEREVELLFVGEHIFQDGSVCSAAFPVLIALAAHQTHSKKHVRGVKRCVASALVCGNQCCNCGAVLASRTCQRTHLKDSVRRGFCRASLDKGCPTQRIVECSPMSCTLCGAQLSENGTALAHMAAHLRTFLPHGDLVR